MPFSTEIVLQHMALPSKCPVHPSWRETSRQSASGYNRNEEAWLGRAWSRVLEQPGCGQTDLRPHSIFISALSGKGGSLIVIRAKNLVATIDTVTTYELPQSLRLRLLSSRF